MNWKKYNKIAIYKREDLVRGEFPKGSIRKTELADLVLNQVDENKYEVEKDRYGWSVGLILTLEDVFITKLFLLGKTI